MKLISSKLKKKCTVLAPQSGPLKFNIILRNSKPTKHYKKKCECKITTNEVFFLEFWEDIVSVEMFLRYSIKISSWLLLTVVSFNFDKYQFSNDLFILLFYKRWSGRIPQTTKLSIHNLSFCFQFTRKSIPTKIIESIVIRFTIINDALLRTLYAYIKYKYICTYWNVHE